MKKLFILLVCVMLLFSLTFVYAAGNGQKNQGVNKNQSPNVISNIQNKEQEQEGNLGLGQTIHNRVRAGTYTNEQGKQIRISELANNRIRLQVRNISADCELNITQEQVQNRTRLKVMLSNGRKAEIKIMPDVASERALERLRLRVCSSENNCSLQLKEVGKGNETKLAYEVQVERHMRILGLFRTKAKVKAEVDAENGEIIRVKKPWWAFLASEPEE